MGFIPRPRIEGIKGDKGKMRIKYWDNYTLWRYVQEVEKIQDGEALPYAWWGFRGWLSHMPIARLTRSETYYVRKFGYRRNGDVYEVDRRCVGAICMVIILVGSGIPISTVARTTGLTERRVRGILKNYKYYVGWHNTYTMDGRRIWPAIREVELLHRDLFEDVIECQ